MIDILQSIMTIHMPILEEAIHTYGMDLDGLKPQLPHLASTKPLLQKEEFEFPSYFVIRH